MNNTGGTFFWSINPWVSYIIILKEGKKLIHPVGQSGSGNTVTRSHHNPMAALTGEPTA